MIAVNNLMAVRQLAGVLGKAALLLRRRGNFAAVCKRRQPVIVIAHDKHLNRLLVVAHHTVVNLLKCDPSFFCAHIGKIAADHQHIHTLLFQHGQGLFKRLVLMGGLVRIVRQLQVADDSHPQGAVLCSYPVGFFRRRLSTVTKMHAYGCPHRRCYRRYGRNHQLRCFAHILFSSCCSFFYNLTRAFTRFTRIIRSPVQNTGAAGCPGSLATAIPGT